MRYVAFCYEIEHTGDIQRETDLARELGLRVVEERDVDFDTETCTLILEDMYAGNAARVLQEDADAVGMCADIFRLKERAK